MSTFLSLVFSLVVVVFGARLFLTASVSLSRLLGLPEMVIGATLVSLATTMPETLVSLFASATAHTPLALGNVVGSGLVNLGLLFGILLLTGQGIEEQTGRGKRRSLILFCLVTFIYLWFLLFGKIDFYGGLILIALAFVFLGYTFWYSFKESGKTLVSIEISLGNHLQVVFKLLAGAFLLILGARFLVSSGVGLVQILGLPEIIIGITFLAVGTSLPELIIALTALFSGHEKIALGNLTGATIFTFTLALGLAATITEIRIPEETLKRDFSVLLFFSIIGVAFSLFPKISQRTLGGVLVLGYLVYLVFLF